MENRTVTAPVKPTREMLRAGARAFLAPNVECSRTPMQIAEQIWEAMVAVLAPDNPSEFVFVVAKEVEFLPMLKASSSQMLSRRMLHEYGVTDEMIDAAAKRGEVVVCRIHPGPPGIFDSILLTEDGANLYP